MADESDDLETYMQNFLANAEKRKAKLETMSDNPAKASAPVHTPRKAREDVCYPNLTPLPEGDETSVTLDTTSQRDDETMTNVSQEGENMSPSMSNLNYSSDLSLEVEPSDVYRAEPIVCDSSPEIHASGRIHQNQLQRQPYGSPRKLAPLAPQQEQKVTMQDQRQPEQKATSSQSLPSPMTDEQIIRDLKRRAEVAEQTKNQLKKLVEISKYGSKEHIDAARRLQISDLEHLTYANQVAMLERGIKKKSESLGSINISGVRLKISNKLREELAEDGVSHYFFCVAICGTEVKASDLVDTNDIRMQDSKTYIHFKEGKNRWGRFDGLPPDFNVKLEVFELIFHQKLPRFLHTLTPSKKSRITPEATFKRVGSLRLTLADREAHYKNLAQWSKHEESKYIERECKLHMELRPEQLPSKFGNLNVRSLYNEGMPDWTRYWVEMSNGQMKFWRSRQDSIDGKKPNQLLEFADICSDMAQKLTPNDELYRQFSFVVYSIQLLAGGEGNNLMQRVLKGDNNYKIVRHQFAADNKEDRDAWCSVLNRSINCFREWQGKTKIYTIDEAKQIFLQYS